jgi:hypothetical protein
MDNQQIAATATAPLATTAPVEMLGLIAPAGSKAWQRIGLRPVGISEGIVVEVLVRSRSRARMADAAGSLDVVTGEFFEFV